MKDGAGTSWDRCLRAEASTLGARMKANVRNKKLREGE